MVVQTLLIAMNTLLLIALLFLVTYKSNIKRQQKGYVIDSCALIDGRIKDLFKVGIVDGYIVIPQFVLRELQMLADGADNYKRARARYGLQIADELKDLYKERFSLYNTLSKSAKTDDQLITLAKKRKLTLCTTDYNLQKVAAVEGVTVININEMAHVMRPVLLPGEEQEVKIIQKGESRGQGIGYLSDGTMVVVENAAKYIGTKQTIIIERSLQTVAGKMSFAHIKPRRSSDRERNR